MESPHTTPGRGSITTQESLLLEGIVQILEYPCLRGSVKHADEGDYPQFKIDAKETASVTTYGSPSGIVEERER